MSDHERSDYWRLHGLPNDITNLPLDGHTSSEENQTYGGGYSLTVRVSPRSDSESGQWPDHLERYQRIINAYTGHAGQYALHELTSGKVAYTEPHEGNSLLVALKPPSDATASRGGYYLVGGVSDQTTLPSAVCLVELELVFLAELSEYENIERAQSFLEADSI